MRFRRPITPAEHRLEMPGKRQIAERHGIARIEHDDVVQQTPRLGKVILGETPDVPVSPHDAVPRVELARRLMLGVPYLSRDDTGGYSTGDALRDLVLDSKHVSQLAIVAVRP